MTLSRLRDLCWILHECNISHVRNVRFSVSPTLVTWECWSGTAEQSPTLSMLGLFQPISVRETLERYDNELILASHVDTVLLQLV